MSSPGVRIINGQAMYSAAWLDDDLAYEPGSPKAPGYADWLAYAADLQRKARKESGLTEGELSREAAGAKTGLSSSVSPPAGGAETFKPPLACQARMPTPGNVWRFCKLPWNHKGGHVF